MDYDVEQLLKKINELSAELKAAKKYGLVWDREHTKEEVVIQCEENIPILVNDKNKTIRNGGQNNILIEGDNYHSLTILNYILKGAIDIIYIDPPYNTGNKDFTYNDNYINSDDGYRHSKWLSFMKKRLDLARELLSDEGVIFISIDDREYAQLKLLCDSIFGEPNFIDSLIWKKTENIKMDSKFLSQNKDYVLIYRKTDNVVGFSKEKSGIERFKLEDKKGRYYLRKLDSLSSSYSRGMDYVITHDGVEYYPGGSKEKWIERQNTPAKKKAPTWLWSKEKYEQGLLDGEIVFKNGNVYNKVRYDGIAKKPYINIQNIVSQQTAQKELDDLFGARVFDHPKPPQLIKWLLNLYNNKEDYLVLDFFAGSGTTGQAVLELNNEDNGNRRFILCTNNENNICENITYERLKTVISGKRSDLSKYSDGLLGNLYYFKTDFIKDEVNTEQAKYNLVEKVDSLLCILEDTYDEVERNDYSSHYKNLNKHLFIYSDYYNVQKFSLFKEKIMSVNGEVAVYIYSGDNNIDENLIKKENVVLKPIPSKIYEIYKELAETIKREN